MPGPTRKCPDCSEEIARTASKCPYCNYDFDAKYGAVVAQKPAGAGMNGNLIVGVIFLLLGIFIFVASMGSNRPFAGVITMVIGVTRIIRGLSG